MLTSRPRRREYELIAGRSSSESPNRLVFPDDAYAFGQQPASQGYLASCRTSLRAWARFARSARFRRAALRLFYLASCVVLSLIVLTPILTPSYTRRPSHYVGANPHQERVFIAANIVDKDLIKGAWGKALLKLIEIIGPENTFLSIYENDSGSDTKIALEELGAELKCRTTHNFCSISY
jgi:hypothetical protein